MWARTGCRHGWTTGLCGGLLALATWSAAWADEAPPAQQAPPGEATAAVSTPAAGSADEIVPVGREGQALNLDFESGTLGDWLADGDAFNGQPIEGDAVHTRRADMHSQHRGRFWIGTFERAGDGPQGTLVSAPFRVTAPFASFWAAGGSSEATRAEIVLQSSGKVIFRASGQNTEDLAPVVVDLGEYQGQEVFLRLVDQSSGGWGHLNFDHFRLHRQRPDFPGQRLLGASDVIAHAGLSPTEAAAAMTVPPGFRVALLAGEPDVQQPIAMCFDDRGRLWVAEAYSYPFRVPEEQARDRILIFEDRDGDDRFESRKVFADKLNLVSGLEVGFGGVWIGSAPELLFLPDRDGDDRPDGPPQVLLDGWGYQDTHETLNAFTWGPDGWLYGCHGVFTHSLVGKPGSSKDQRQPINAGIWRYHPTRHVFEVFAHGTSNPWGVDFDDYGRALATACVIPHLFHIVPGGRYQRQAGQHFNRHTYGDLVTIADHVHWLGSQPHAGNNRSDSAGGGHAHSGAMIYLGGSWPAEYRGSIFMNNIHGARLNRDLLEPRGSGLVGRHAPDFLLTHDSWSQIINLQTDPAGQMVMIDWYDQNQCHRVENEVHDRSNGRIFRVSYGQPDRQPVDLAARSSAELVALQLSANDWLVRHARRLLQERGPDPAVHAALTEIATTHADETRRLRAVWALHVTGGLTPSLVEQLLASEFPHVRAWMVQLACETERPSDSTLEVFGKLAHGDPSPEVRLALAAALQRLPLADRPAVLRGLLAHGQDQSDHNLPLMIWYAAEPLAESDPALALSLVEQGQIPLVLQYMVRRIAAEGSAESLAQLTETLGRQSSPEMQRMVLAGIREALRGRRQVAMPPHWSEVAQRLAAAADAALEQELTGLSVTFGDPKAIDRVRRQLSDSQADLNQRQAALDALVARKDPALAPVLLELLAEPALRQPALRALAGYDHPQTPGRILDLYPQLNTPERRDALATLAARVASAEQLLDAIAAGQVPRADLGAEVLRQLRQLKSPAFQQRLADVFGVVRDSPIDKVKRIGEFRRLLGQTGGPPADLAAGRTVFAKTCQQCHRLFGVGGQVGPELTGSNRADLEYLLSNVLDPSAVMAKEYIPTVLVTTDGRVITGIVKAETESSLTVVTANETLEIPRAEIDEQQPSDKSMMPDDLWGQLRPDEVRNLVAYLGSPAQVPLAATAENLAQFFTGRDLTGWQGDPAVWSVSEGEIVGRAASLDHDELLVSELALADFALRFELWFAPESAVAGVQLRSQTADDGSLRGPLLELRGGHWGQLRETAGRGLLASPSSPLELSARHWHPIEIRCQGPRFQIDIDGKPAVVYDDAASPRRGVLAFKLGSGGQAEVRVRHLQLELIGPAEVAQGGK